MSTTYPGSATATEAPSVPPTPGVVPSVVIPADGESLNVASITQALKVLADFQAWQMSPRAKASDWLVPVQVWRDAALRRKFGIDHLGYPMGKLQVWQENWPGNLSVTGGNPVQFSATTESGWAFGSYKQGAGVGTVDARVPDANFPATRSVRIFSGDSASDYSFATRSAPCLFHADVAFAMEWDLKVNALQNYSIGMGFNSYTDYIAAAHGPIAQFYNLGGAGNWLCRTDDGTTLNSVDSGVAIGTGKGRYRIEYHGANVDDAGVERVLFFINGVLRANVTANMPSAAPSPIARPLFIQFNSGGNTGILDMGPVRFGGNLWPTDVF